MKSFTFDYQSLSGGSSIPITVKYHTSNAFIISRQQHDFENHEEYLDCLSVVKQLILYREKNLWGQSDGSYY